MKSETLKERTISDPVDLDERSEGSSFCLNCQVNGEWKILSVRSCFLLLILILPLIFCAAGCNGYQCGTRSLYRNEIKTVFVPMVQADSWRKALGERLTESVCKRITERTPFDLAGPGDADTVLAINLVADNHSASIMNRYNDTAQKTISWSIIAVWKDKSDNILAQLDPIPLSGNGVALTEQSFLVAEMGQSNATAQQEVIDKLADRIVGLMEEPW
ncbi:MAG: LPS assembly lipoprotein LptE [Planctomycetia bacterium]|nr:LPS assembly lipoprotein LptE [Planctomycetia bacterium]